MAHILDEETTFDAAPIGSQATSIVCRESGCARSPYASDDRCKFHHDIAEYARIRAVERGLRPGKRVRVRATGGSLASGTLRSGVHETRRRHVLVVSILFDGQSFPRDVPLSEIVEVIG